MKKKKDLPQMLTKEDFEKAISKLSTKEEVSKLATGDDIKNLQSEISGISKDVVSLKTDVENIKTEIKEFKIDMAVQLSGLETNIDDKAKKYRDQILTSMDKTMGELEEIRIEQAFSKRQDKEFQKQFDHHTKRIKKLEQRAQVA